MMNNEKLLGSSFDMTSMVKAYNILVLFYAIFSLNYNFKTNAFMETINICTKHSLV
jgi:hypothetical protein